MRRYRGIVFDLDNTAVPEGALNVDSEELMGLFNSLDPSVPAIAATGRTIEYALPVLRDMSLAHESIVANGAQIIESSTGRIIQENNLSQKQVKQIIDLCYKYDSAAHCCVAGDSMGSVITAREQEAREAPGIFFMNLEREVADEFYTDVSLSIEGINGYISSSYEDGELRYDVNIGSVEANKGSALRKIIGGKALNLSEVVAVGDDVNDISLFEIVGHRIAMADAHPDLLAMADEVVAPQSQGGFVEVLRRFVLLN